MRIYILHYFSGGGGGAIYFCEWLVMVLNVSGLLDLWHTLYIFW